MRGGQCERLARVLGPTAEANRAYVVQAPVVHADETPWYMLKKGRQKQWMWSLSCHDAAFYRIDPSRGHQVIVELLEGFEVYTLLESANLARVEPRAYLRAAAEAALRGRAPLLPHVHRELAPPS